MRTICPNCKSEFAIQPQHIGITTVCQSCGKPFVVADADLQPPLLPQTAHPGAPDSRKQPRPQDSVKSKVSRHPAFYISLFYALIFAGGFVFFMMQLGSARLNQKWIVILFFSSFLLGAASVYLIVMLSSMLNSLKKVLYIWEKDI